MHTHDLVLYSALFVGMLFEGDLLLFGATFLVLNGTLDPLIALPIALISALVGDVGWYYMGLHLAKKPEGKAARIVRRVTRILDGRVTRSPRRVVFVSKLTYGLHRPIIMRFGLEKFGAWRFFKVDVPAVLAWFVTISGLAVAAHLTLLPVSKYLRIVELILLALFALFIFTESGASRLVRKLLPADMNDAWYDKDVDNPEKSQS